MLICYERNAFAASCGGKYSDRVHAAPQLFQVSGHNLSPVGKNGRRSLFTLSSPFEYAVKLHDIAGRVGAPHKNNCMRSFVSDRSSNGHQSASRLKAVIAQQVGGCTTHPRSEIGRPLSTIPHRDGS